MNEVIEALMKQRTTRRNEFSDKRIATTDIETLKTVILKTANASNRQSYTIIILDRDKAGGLGFPGDTVFLFCVDFHRLHLCAEKLGLDFDSSYLMQFATALTDISMLAQSTILAAQSMGIGTLITNEVYHNKLETLFTALQLPARHVFPMLAVCMGYSKAEGKPEKGRINPWHIFHDNIYIDPTSSEIEELIAKYDNKAENIGLVKNWDEKGHKHYLEWFFDKWSTAIGNRKQGEAFHDALKKHDMM